MSKLSSLSYAVVVTSALLMSNIAFANSPPAITPQGAVELKQIVEDQLQWRLNMAKSLHTGVKMDGTIQVTPKSGYYEVKLPNLEVLLDPVTRLDVGTVIMNASPGTQTGEWLISLALPPVMTAYKGTKTPVARLTIGSQKFAGAWWPEKSMFSKVNAQYKDIKMIDLASPANVTADIASLTSTLNLKDNGDNTWSGPNHTEVNELKITASGTDEGSIVIHKITNAIILGKFDMSQSLALNKKMKELFKNSTPPSEAEIKSMINTLVQSSRSMLGDWNDTLEVGGIAIHGKDKSTQNPQDLNLSLNRLGLTYSIQGARQEKGSAGVTLGMDGLKMSFAPVEYTGLIPTALNFDVKADNLPFQKMTDTLFTALQKTIEMAEVRAADKNAETPAQTEMAMAFASLPKLLSDAGATLTIANTFVNTPDMQTRLDARIDASNAAALGAMGQATVVMTGFEDTIKKLQTLSTQPNANHELIGIAQGLSVVQMMGQEEKTADGKSSRKYVFQLTPDGKIMLNNLDIKNVAGMLGGGQQGSPQGGAQALPVQQGK